MGTVSEDNFEYQIHGLLGQTIYNQIFDYSKFKYTQGQIEDYIVTDLFADDFMYNLYG